MTAPVFHRLTVPSYFGGLPANYDFINNATSGTPANAAGILTYGPNIGSYFVGFGDDGTSADANRPALALATNTDYLDDLLHADLAIVTPTSNTGPTSSPTSSVTLTGPGVFLGITLTTPLTELFQITDGNDNDIEVSGSRCVVTDVSGGTVGSGFSAGNVALTINPAIPTGSTFRIYYGQQSNLATLPADALMATRLGRGDLTDFQDFVAQVSAPGVMPGTVTALVATDIQTPTVGSRLPQSPDIFFDVDPSDSGASDRAFFFRTRRDTSNSQVIGILADYPGDPTVPGINTIFTLTSASGSNGLYAASGTEFFSDNNVAGAATTNWVPAIPLSSPATVNGDQWERLFEKPLLTAAASGTPPLSILQKMNSRWEVTVGDGVNSFGDVNGDGALDLILTYFANTGAGAGRILLKPGFYSITTSHSLAMTGSLTIEGESAESTIITVDITSSEIALDVTEGTLYLKNLYMANVNTDVATVRTHAGVCMALSGVYTVDMSYALINPGTLPAQGALTDGQTFYAENSTFTMGISGNTTFSFNGGDGNIHTGVYFNNVLFSHADNTNPVTFTLYTSPTGTTTFSDVRFLDCTYILGGTQDNGGQLLFNTGVLSLDPVGTAGQLSVSDVLWENCSANVFYSTGSSTCQILAEVTPVPYYATSSSDYTLLGRLTLINCDWGLVGDVSSAINPVTLLASRVVVRQCTFIGTAAYVSSASTITQYVLLTSYSAANWGQFTFGPNSALALFTSGFNTDFGIVMDDVVFWNFGRLSVLCDATVILPSTSNDASVPGASQSSIKNVRFWGYADGSGGSLPNYRFYLSTTTTVIGPSDVACVVENVLMEGVSASFNWANNGIFGIDPATGLDLYSCGVYNWTNTDAETDNGYYINYVDSTVNGYGIRLTNCIASGMTGNGITVAPGGSSSSGLDGLEVIGGSYSNNTGFGFDCNAKVVTMVRIAGARFQDNTLAGIRFNLQTGGGPTTLFLLDNYCQGNSGGAENSIQIEITGTYGGSDFVYGFARNNTCLGSESSPEYNAGNFFYNPTLPSSGALVSNFTFGGLHTGGSGSDSPVVYFANGNPMMENYAYLQTS